MVQQTKGRESSISLRGEGGGELIMLICSKCSGLAACIMGHYTATMVRLLHLPTLKIMNRAVTAFRDVVGLVHILKMEQHLPPKRR
jgi:hypothetical protein